MYHALDISGKKSDAHKDQKVKENVYHILDGQGNNSDIQKRESEYHVLKEPGDNDDTYNDA